MKTSERPTLVVEYTALQEARCDESGGFLEL